jgi:hypothetical protein
LSRAKSRKFFDTAPFYEKNLGRILLVEKTKKYKKIQKKMSNKFQKNRGKSGQFQTKTEVGIRPFANANCAQRISAWEGSMVIAISHSPSTLPPSFSQVRRHHHGGAREHAREIPPLG